MLIALVPLVRLRVAPERVESVILPLIWVLRRADGIFNGRALLATALAKVPLQILPGLAGPVRRGPPPPPAEPVSPARKLLQKTLQRRWDVDAVNTATISNDNKSGEKG